MSIKYWGVRIRWKSAWIGAHYSDGEKRICINPIPCLTFWFVFDGGTVPNGSDLYRSDKQ